MPQLNASLIDMTIINSFLFLYIFDCVTIIVDTDDDLLEFRNVTLIIQTSILILGVVISSA